jgi:hypothetical protein
MIQRRPVKRTSGKRNDRNEDNPNYAPYEDDNPAWQSNSKIGSRARVMNGSATYTWKFGDETGGLERRDLRKEPVKGQVGKFNAEGLMYQKNRIKSIIAKNGALQRNKWVKFVKAAQKAWNEKNDIQKTYPCIIGDSIIQLMYHAKNRNSSTGERKPNPFPARYYPYINTTDMITEYQKRDINYSIYVTISRDDIPGDTEKINIFDTIDNRNEFRITIINRFQNVLSSESKIEDDTNEENFGFDTAIDSYENDDTAMVAEDGAPIVKENITIEDILTPKELPPLVESKLLTDSFEEEFIFVLTDGPQNSTEFQTTDLKTLINPNKSLQQIYNSWLNSTIISSFVTVRSYDVRNLGLVLVNSFQFLAYFKSERKTSQRRDFDDMLKENRGWIIIPIVDNARNKHWYMITVTFTPRVDSVDYNVAVWDSLYNSMKDLHKEHVNLINRKMDDLFTQPGYVINNISDDGASSSTKLGFYYAHEKMTPSITLQQWPQQEDGVSCGVFTILFLLFVTEESIRTASRDRSKPLIPITNLTGLSMEKIIDLRIALGEYIIRRYTKFNRQEYALRNRVLASTGRNRSVSPEPEDTISPEPEDITRPNKKPKIELKPTPLSNITTRQRSKPKPLAPSRISTRPKREPKSSTRPMAKDFVPS